MKSLFLALFCAFFGLTLSAQIGANSGAQNIVEFDKFSPPTKEMIATFEGFPAIPFIANDQNDSEINLASFKGQTVLLWFLDTDNSLALSQIPLLNEISKKGNTKVIAFNEGSRQKLQQFVAANQIDFSMIPHAGIFGEGPYGGDLGYPRVFIIDSFGIIQKVLPGEAFSAEADIKSNLLNYLTTLK